MTIHRQRRRAAGIGPRRVPLVQRWTAGLVCLLLALTATLAGEAAPAGETEVVGFGSSMLYLRNTSDPAIGLDWTTFDFDETGWIPGNYGIGYDNGGAADDLLQTVIANTTHSVYTRVTFQIEDAAQIENMFAGADFDDGYVAWLNGVEVARSDSMPDGDPDWNTPSGEHESSNGSQPKYELRNITSVGLPWLRSGDNVLAVGVWNKSPGSSDMVLAPTLIVNADLEERPVRQPCAVRCGSRHSRFHRRLG